MSAVFATQNPQHDDTDDGENDNNSHSHRQTDVECNVRIQRSFRCYKYNRNKLKTDEIFDCKSIILGFLCNESARVSEFENARPVDELVMIEFEFIIRQETENVTVTIQ
jgi:hypothetical protein